MAQINEYLPDTGVQGAVGGVTPNLEAVSLFGKGLEHVGSGLQEVSDVVHKREYQQEISQVYGQFAQARADWNVKLKQRLRNGTLDPDQFDQEYADYINKIGDNLKTAEGKNFFNRQAYRLGGTLMQNAITGKAQIDGEKAFQEINTGVNVHVANLMTHPDQAPDAIDATQELIAAKKADGTIDTVQSIRLQKQLVPQLAEAAVKGFANQDPGVDEKGNPHENVGKQFLDNGGFAEYLNEPQRAALYSYAREADNRRRIETDREESTAHRSLQRQGLEYMDQASNKILNGTYSLKELNSAPLTLEQKLYVKHQVDAVNKEESVTDKPTFNRVYKQLLSGEITTHEQLNQLVLDGAKIAPHDMPFLYKQIDSTPDGLVVKNMQKGIDKMIDRQFNIKGVGGAPMVGAQAAAADARMEIMQAQQAFVAGGGTPKDFYSNTNMKDPASPYAILQKHQISMPDMLQMQAQQLQSQVTGQGNNPNVNRYSNSPTKEVPPPSSAPQTPPQQNSFFNNDLGKNAGSTMETLGLGESDAAKERRTKKEAQWKADHPNQPLPAAVSEKKAEPSESLRKPGESIEAYSKRLGLK